MDAVEAVVRNIRMHIETGAGIDQRLPQGVGIMVSNGKVITFLEAFTYLWLRKLHVMTASPHVHNLSHVLSES
jgi:hypothetical protein